MSKRSLTEGFTYPGGVARDKMRDPRPKSTELEVFDDVHLRLQPVAEACITFRMVRTSSGDYTEQGALKRKDVFAVVEVSGEDYKTFEQEMPKVGENWGTFTSRLLEDRAKAAGVLDADVEQSTEPLETAIRTSGEHTT